VNLSRSGAARKPWIVAAPDGTLQAFWWDQFDGLMTTVFSEGAWSAPSSAPILVTVVVSEEQVVRTPVEVMPTIVADGRGFAYALWIGEADEDTGARPLLRSQMRIGSIFWTPPEGLAESAVAFETAQSPDGGLVLAYVRPAHSDQFAAGIYVKTTPGGGGAWSAPAVVYQTIYFRTMTGETTHLRIGAGGDGAIDLAWEDPYRGLALHARSTDGGATWSDPEDLGQREDTPTRPRAFALPNGGALRMWEAAGMGACTLHQEQLEASEVLTPTWGPPLPVLEGLSACPQGDETLWHHDGRLLWLWGGGGGELTLAARGSPTGQWSEPRSFSFSFDDPVMARRVNLGALHATLVSDTLAIVGADPSSADVWSISGQATAWELAFAPPSPWAAPVRVSEEGVAATSPAVALDAEGNAHIVWSQSTTADGPGTAIAYARWDATAGRLSRAVEVVRGTANQELARHPALLADPQGLLHLVWSGNAEGQIMYSRARPAEAGSPGGWSSPLSLPMPARAGSWPQIAVDGAGGLIVAYAVPLNEARGIYLVRSSDGGETWTEPDTVFDAEAAGWPMVDRPALAVAPDGGSHVAWLEGALPGTWSPQAVHYSLSPDGASWSGPWKATEMGAEWPRLVATGGRVHLLYTGIGGGVWHRSAPLDQAGELAGWSQPARVSGFGEVDGPFGTAADETGAIHLLGGSSGNSALAYSTWDGERWIASDGLFLGPLVQGVRGASGAASPEGKWLAVALAAEVADQREGAGIGADSSAPAILFTYRTVGSTAVSPLPTPLPEQGPEPEEAPAVEPTPTDAAASSSEAPLPTVALPTEGPAETPDLAAGGVPDTTTSQLPMIAGIGLGAVALLALVGAWVVSRGRRD